MDKVLQGDGSKVLGVQRNTKGKSLKLMDNMLVNKAHLTDNKAPITDSTNFKVIGIDKMELLDTDGQVYELDVDKNGDKENTSKTYLTSKITVKTGMIGPYAFVNKNYQTAHWYNFKVRITWSDSSYEEYLGPEKDEAIWSYTSDYGAGSTLKGYTNDDISVTTKKFYTNGKAYNPKLGGGVQSDAPIDAQNHRVPNSGWNAIRFDLFSDGNIRQPSSNGNNPENGRTYIIGNYWSHEGAGIAITGEDGKTIINKDYVNYGETKGYKGFILWEDGDYTMQNGQTQANYPKTKNPWNPTLKPLDITNNSGKFPNTDWEMKELQNPKLSTATDVLGITFNQYEAGKSYRTLSVSWGDNYVNTRNVKLPNDFKYWDFYSQQLLIQVGGNPDTDINGGTGNTSSQTADSNSNLGCSNEVPRYDCDLPTTNNWRMPNKVSIDVPRLTEGQVQFNVTGISKGTGN